jgi:hypothetical protein
MSFHSTFTSSDSRTWNRSGLRLLYQWPTKFIGKAKFYQFDPLAGPHPVGWLTTWTTWQHFLSSSRPRPKARHRPAILYWFWFEPCRPTFCTCRPPSTRHDREWALLARQKHCACSGSQRDKNTTRSCPKAMWEGTKVGGYLLPAIQAWKIRGWRRTLSGTKLWFVRHHSIAAWHVVNVVMHKPQVFARIIHYLSDRNPRCQAQNKHCLTLCQEPMKILFRLELHTCTMYTFENLHGFHIPWLLESTALPWLQHVVSWTCYKSYQHTLHSKCLINVSFTDRELIDVIIQREISS